MSGIDPITAIGNAVSEVFGTAKPFVENYLAQKYENEKRKRMAEWDDVMSEKDDKRRADRIHAYIMRLFNDAGTSTGSVGTKCVNVPVDILDEFVNLVCEKIYNDQILASIRFKQ